MLEVLRVWAGRDGVYGKSATYDDWEQAFVQIQAVLEAGDQVLIKPARMTEAEFIACGPEFGDETNPLL